MFLLPVEVTEECGTVSLVTIYVFFITSYRGSVRSITFSLYIENDSENVLNWYEFECSVECWVLCKRMVNKICIFGCVCVCARVYIHVCVWMHVRSLYKDLFVCITGVVWAGMRTMYHWTAENVVAILWSDLVPCVKVAATVSGSGISPWWVRITN